MLGDWSSIDFDCFTKISPATPKYIKTRGQCMRVDGEVITKKSGTSTVANIAECEQTCI